MGERARMPLRLSRGPRRLGAATALVAASAWIVSSVGCEGPPERVVRADAGDADAAVDAGAEAIVFSESFAGLAGDYGVGDDLGDWRVLRAHAGARVISAEGADIPARRGANVFYFPEFSGDPGFSESRIDRCVEFDATRSLSFDYHVYADLDVHFVTDHLRVRVNPNFYEDVEACEADVAIDSTGGRLEETGAWYNEDWDVRLESAGAEPGAWFHATRATHNAPAPDMSYSAGDYPAGAEALRFSVRARDDLYSPGTSRRLYTDDIRVTQP